jgi:hypothetical protein
MAEIIAYEEDVMLMRHHIEDLELKKNVETMTDT